MLTEPSIRTRTPEPYAAKIIEVEQSEIARRAPPLIQEVMDWVVANGGTRTGPPFFNYVAFLPGGRMKMAVGVATKEVMVGGESVTTGELPGGRYASITYTGAYDGLYAANMALDKWIEGRGLAYAGRESDGGFLDATRLEIYFDPGTATSPPRTEVAFRLRD